MKQRIIHFFKGLSVKRILMSVLGVVTCGIGVGFFKRANLGVDPFQTLMSGLDAVIPIDFGTLYVIANVILLLFSLIADRHYIGIATFINLFLLGYIADFSEKLLWTLFPADALWVQIVFLAIGIAILCFASAVYFEADYGVSTYDAVALIITGTWKKGRFKYVRIATDFVCVLAGSALILSTGATFKTLLEDVGAGTVITAFFMGPLVDLFRRKVIHPLFKVREDTPA